MSSTQNIEHEVRFLEIDSENIKAKLTSIGAHDEGEVLLKEVILYDKELTWQKDKGHVMRVRQKGNVVTLAYKHHHSTDIGGVEEVEIEVSDFDKTVLLLEKVGLVVYRHQEKKRHTFTLGNVVFDIDTWPRIPTYIEIEGPDEVSIRNAAEKIGLSWSAVEYTGPTQIIERYGYKVREMKWFTFERFE